MLANLHHIISRPLFLLSYLQNSRFLRFRDTQISIRIHIIFLLFKVQIWKSPCLVNLLGPFWQGAATDEYPCPEKHFFFLATTQGRCFVWVWIPSFSWLLIVNDLVACVRPSYTLQNQEKKTFFTKPYKFVSFLSMRFFIWTTKFNFKNSQTIQ